MVFCKILYGTNINAITTRYTKFNEKTLWSKYIYIYFLKHHIVIYNSEILDSS